MLWKAIPSSPEWPLIKETQDAEMANQGVTSFLIRCGIHNTLDIPPNFQVTERDRTKLHSEGLAATIAVYYPNFSRSIRIARENLLATCVVTHWGAQSCRNANLDILVMFHERYSEVNLWINRVDPCLRLQK